MEIIQLLLNTFWLVLITIVFSILLYSGSVSSLLEEKKIENKKTILEKEVYKG